MDLLRIGEGIDSFPAVETDPLVLARRMLFGFCLNPMAIRMQCIRNELSRPLKKRRRGLSAATASGNRKRSQKGRQRLRPAQHYPGMVTYMEHDAASWCRLEGRMA